MTAYIDIRGPNRELQLPIWSSDSCNSYLKGVILHEGDSIENRNYFGIFSKILFDNTDNNTIDIETIKKRSQEVKIKHKQAVPCSLPLQLVYFIDIFKGNL